MENHGYFTVVSLKAMLQLSGESTEHEPSTL